jgi:hypothetical protein
MRKTTEFNIDNRRITVKELTLRQIQQMFQDKRIASVSITMETIQEVLPKYLPWIVDGITVEELPDFTPSELKVLWDKIKETNSDFFDGARSLGLDKLVVQIREQIWSNFSRLAAVL